MLKRFRIFLGPERFNLLLGLLIGTGIFSIVLLAIQEAWSQTLQTLSLAVFITGAALIIGGRMERDQRRTWLAVLAPGFGLVLLGNLFPSLRALFWGGAFGWVLVGLLIFGRTRAPQQYRNAIKAMRKHDYKGAVDEMSELIKDEPNTANHYRFRATLFRLWGKPDRARRDYQRMLEISDELAVQVEAYNGLSELETQQGRYQDALAAARKAHDLVPEQWVAAYNVGMIHDRLAQPQEALASLDQALALKIPDARHRLLVHLWRARAYARLGAADSAQQAADKMRREQAGLKEWQTIMQSNEAETLRTVLAADIETAANIVNGEMQPAQLATDTKTAKAAQ